MAKAFSMPTEWALIRRVDAEARRIWRYGEESFSEAWLRAYESLACV